MSELITGIHLGRQVCEVLGVPPDMVTRIVFTLEPNKPVRVEIDGVLRTADKFKEWRGVVEKLRDADIHLTINADGFDPVDPVVLPTRPDP